MIITSIADRELASALPAGDLNENFVARFRALAISIATSTALDRVISLVVMVGQSPN